jgi:hypothetical protein
VRHLISRLLFLVLLAFVAWNAWQVSLLRKEVADLQNQIATLETVHGTSQRGAGNNSLIGKASRHAEKARKLIAKGDFKGGRLEIEKSLQLLEKAGRDATAPSTAALDKLKRSIDEVRAIADHAWQQTQEKPPLKEKGEKTGEKDHLHR